MLQYVTPHVPIAAGPINEKSVMDKKKRGHLFLFLKWAGLYL